MWQVNRQSEFDIDFCNDFRLFDCPWKCLTECPIPGQDCYWDDPDYPILEELPKLGAWRYNHPELVRKEPEDPMRNRCPRCFSVRFTIGYPYMECKNCGYSEPRIDFPLSEDWYLWWEASSAKQLEMKLQGRA